MPTTFTEITALTVKRLRPDPAGEPFIRDTLLPGFGIRIQPSGSASYSAEARVSGTSRTRRKSLGAVSKLTVPAARAAAKTFLGRAALGVDAVAEGKAALAAAEAERVPGRGPRQTYPRELRASRRRRHGIPDRPPPHPASIRL